MPSASRIRVILSYMKKKRLKSLVTHTLFHTVMFFRKQLKSDSERWHRMVKLKKYEDLQAMTADWKIAFHSYKDQDDTWPATVKDIIAKIKRECLNI